MTIDEAIKQLTTYSIPCGKYKNAYDMAIDSMRKLYEISRIANRWKSYGGDFGSMQEIYEVLNGYVD